MGQFDGMAVTARGRRRVLQEAENPTDAIELHFMFQNLAWPGMTLVERAGGIRTTAAMAPTFACHMWTLTELAALLDSNWPTTRLHARNTTSASASWPSAATAGLARANTDGLPPGCRRPES